MGVPCEETIVLGPTIFLHAAAVPPPPPYAGATNPYDYNTADPAIGLSLYTEHCAECHGPFGRADGPVAETLCPRPENLHQASRLHDDPYLLWVVSEGTEAVGGSSGMPGFADVLSEDERWRIITTLRLSFTDGVGPQ